MSMDEIEAEKLLSWCEQSISKNREKWLCRTSGPYWSEMHRYVKLYDMVREMQAEREVIIDSAAEEIAHLKAKNGNLLSALKSMVRQYCATGKTDDKGNPYYSHDFMSAGEEAIDLLWRLGELADVGLENYCFTEDLNG